MSIVDPHRLDSEAWLAHREFARRFALALVGDLDRADDLAQDALLAAVDRPPRDSAAMRGWLSRVVRNLAWRGRVLARAFARELSVASTESLWWEMSSSCVSVGR